jgi:hypothetical protein
VSRLTETFWSTDTWHAYERLCGDTPGTRARLLASADWQTRVVDLSVSEAELWRGVRRSYHSLIRKAERDFVLRVVDWTSESDSCSGVESAMRLHRLVAKRQTRSLSTWTSQFLWMINGQAALVVAHQKQVEEGFVYCVIHGAWAYYHSSATHKDNLNHALLWHAMKALKARGVRWFEVGWQGEAKDAKGKAIEFFKSGWPGKDILARDAPRLCCETLL